MEHTYRDPDGMRNTKYWYVLQLDLLRDTHHIAQEECVLLCPHEKNWESQHRDGKVGTIRLRAHLLNPPHDTICSCWSFRQRLGREFRSRYDDNLHMTPLIDHLPDPVHDMICSCWDFRQRLARGCQSTYDDKLHMIYLKCPLSGPAHDRLYSSEDLWRTHCRAGDCLAIP